ncbi:archaellin/type IV pilin N-terminal domain-containing protein [Thermofilum sp.]|jgi:flagellin-like protein|uniref:archaellin/type IV pilin N-terminal domain-containing protein n=1 Tax=Thermofilum sp. TaxID=1961369 RepID=UPI00258EF7CF|nr:archaellin/type IV pilin N-terminal domain-containing protein [Thermofilum sp.]
MQKRRGISPVIATVIIVAVTIAVAIAVAFWMTGIVGLFTGFEQLQIVSTWDGPHGIMIVVKNAGTSTATIDDIFINGRPSSEWGLGINGSSVNLLGINGSSVNLPYPINPGQQVAFNLTFSKVPSGYVVNPGTSLEIKLHTAAGKDYPKLIVLQAYKAPQG